MNIKNALLFIFLSFISSTNAHSDDLDRIIIANANSPEGQALGLLILLADSLDKAQTKKNPQPTAEEQEYCSEEEQICYNDNEIEADINSDESILTPEEDQVCEE